MDFQKFATAETGSKIFQLALTLFYRRDFFQGQPVTFIVIIEENEVGSKVAPFAVYRQIERYGTSKTY